MCDEGGAHRIAATLRLLVVSQWTIGQIIRKPMVNPFGAKLFPRCGIQKSVTHSQPYKSDMRHTHFYCPLIFKGKKGLRLMIFETLVASMCKYGGVACVLIGGLTAFYSHFPTLSSLFLLFLLKFCLQLLNSYPYKKKDCLKE